MTLGMLCLFNVGDGVGWRNDFENAKMLIDEELLYNWHASKHVTLFVVIIIAVRRDCRRDKGANQGEGVNRLIELRNIHAKEIN